MKVIKNAYYHCVKIKCVISSESTKVKIRKKIFKVKRTFGGIKLWFKVGLFTHQKGFFLTENR